MDIVAARRLGEAQREAVRNIGEPLHHQRAARQVIETEINHIQRGVNLVDPHLEARYHVAALLAVDFHRQQAVTDKRVVGAGVAGVAAGAHHRAYVAEVAGDFRVQTANTDGTLFHIRRAEQHIHQLLHVAPHLLRQLTGLDHVLFQQVAADPADQVKAVGFTRAGKDLCHLHRGFAHAEELHKAGVKAGKVAGQTEVQQVRVQAFHLQQNGADHLRPLRHHDAHRVLHRGGVSGAVGEAADAAHPVRQEGHFVITHAGFRQLFHPAMDVEQAVVGVDNVLAVNEQAEVARFIRGDVQRANRHHVVFLAAELVNKLVGFGVGGRRRTLAIIHAVFAQRIEFVRPVVRQHQPAFVRQADRHQAVHITHFALAPYRRRDARRHRRVFRFVGVHFHAHGDPAFGALLHRQHVIDRVVAVELTFIVAEQHRQPAALLVVEKLHHFRQVIDLHGDG